ncbi:hypothetical protein GJAV_G00090720 [Gymnothorax javanicus]|nr:hypothetical protein GJAV_G00090720 [Gymnothorax javanicus]
MMPLSTLTSYRNPSRKTVPWATSGRGFRQENQQEAGSSQHCSNSGPANQSTVCNRCKMEQCLPRAEAKKKRPKQNVREVTPSDPTGRHEEKNKIPKDSVSTSSKLSASHENLSDSSNATGPELLKKMKSNLRPVTSPAQSDRDVNQSESSKEYRKATDTEKESRTVHSDLSASSDSLSKVSSTEGSGILKKIKKGLRPAESTGESDRNINQSENIEEHGAEANTQKESLTANSKLSASNDDLSDNKKSSRLLKGMKKKLRPGTPAAQSVREINQSESAEDHAGVNDAQKEKLTAQRELSVSSDSLSDITGTKGSGIMKKIKQSLRPAQPTPQSGKDINQSDHGQDQREATNTRKGSLGANLELSASNDSLSDKRKEGLTPHGDLSASNDRLSDIGKEEGPGILNKIKKRFRPMKSTTQEDESMPSEIASSNDSLLDANAKEKGGMFSGMFKSKSQQSSKDPTSPLDSVSARSELSASIDSLSENSSSKISADSDVVDSTQTHNTTEEEPPENTQSKGGKLIGMFRKPPKPTERSLPVQENESVPTEHSANDTSCPDVNTKDKGEKITDRVRRTPKPADRNRLAQKNDSTSSELSVNNDASAEGPLDVNTKEKGGMFSGIFKKSSKPAESTALPQEEETIQSDLSSSNDSLLDISTKEKGGIFSGMFRSKSPKHPKESTSAPDSQSELSASNDSLSEKSNPKTATESSQSESTDNNEETDNRQDRGLGIFWKSPKDRTATFTSYVNPKEHEGVTDNKQEKGMFSGMFKSKSPKYSKDATSVQDNPSAHTEPGSSIDSLPDNNAQISSDSNFVDPLQTHSTDTKQEPPESTQKGGKLPGLFWKSPKLAESSLPEQEEEPAVSELSASKENLLDVPVKEKGGMFSGMFRSKSPKRSEDRTSAQVAAERGTSAGENEKREQSFRRKRKVSFRVKRTVPRFPGVTLQPQIEEDEELLPESVEMQELPPMQENSVEVEMVEMALFTSDNMVQDDDDEDDLLLWWRTVEGWNEWNESSNFQEDEEEQAVEQAADRVYLAAQLFVRLFNQRGASLQKHILELLSMADAADNFHKRALKASMGGRVASVVGSVTTITGLILAPFTFGSSIIVTAVGIGVATAGTITSASAHITDSVHSTLDRKKVEKIIQDYEGEIKDIRECMEFVQAGMDALQGWNFEKYTDSVAKRALNRNIKHVVKEGARAGKALMINTDKLVNTVQILSVAGGAAKAAQAISVTTGVMSALFLALDIFFLAKDSHDLRKGAKTKFAKKLRDVCKELQDGLLELNRLKTELQKTMDGVEVEEFEEEEDEVEDDEESDLESDPVKLAELEEEINLIEQKLDQEVLEKKKTAGGEGEKGVEKG